MADEVTSLDHNPQSTVARIMTRGFSCGDPIKLLKRFHNQGYGTDEEFENLVWLGLVSPPIDYAASAAQYRSFSMDNWRLTDAGQMVLGTQLSRQHKYLLIVRQMSKMTYPCPFDVGALKAKEHPLSQLITLIGDDGCIFGDLIRASVASNIKHLSPEQKATSEEEISLRIFQRETKPAIKTANGLVDTLYRAGLIGFEGDTDKDLRKLYLSQDSDKQLMITQILDQSRQVASRIANTVIKTRALDDYDTWLAWLQDPMQMQIFEHQLETAPDQWVPVTAASEKRFQKVKDDSSKRAFIEYLEQKRGAPGFESAKKILQVMRRSNIAEANLLEGWSIDDLLAEKQRPALQELAMTQAFAGYDHYTQKGLHAGLTVDNKRHIQYAGSGKTDLAIDFENFTLVVESNLRASTLQGDSEPGITMRHLEKEANKRPGLPAYGFLVCGAQEKVAKATIGLSHSIAEGVALGSTIHKASIPVTDAQVVTLLEALQKRGNEANDLCEFLEYSIKAAASAEPKIWYKIISHSIEILSTPEAIDAKLPISDIIQKAAQKMGQPLNWPSGTLAPAEDLAPALGI